MKGLAISASRRRGRSASVANPIWL